MRKICLWVLLFANLGLAGVVHASNPAAVGDEAEVIMATADDQNPSDENDGSDDTESTSALTAFDGNEWEMASGALAYYDRCTKTRRCTPRGCRIVYVCY